MHALVHSAAKPLPKFWGGEKFSKYHSIGENAYAFEIAKGNVRGMMPSQLVRAGINPNSDIKVEFIRFGIESKFWYSLAHDYATELRKGVLATQRDWETRNAVPGKPQRYVMRYR